MQPTNNNIPEQPFKDFTDVCADASWRYGADPPCSCDTDNLGFVTASCDSTEYNVSVTEIIENGYIAKQEYCDDQLCVSTYQNSKYNSCHAKERHDGGGHHHVRGRYTCHERPNVCWDEQTQEKTASGMVIQRHGKSGVSVLCFQEPSVPIFVHGVNSTSSTSSRSLYISSSNWIIVGVTFWVLFTIFVCIACWAEDPDGEESSRRLGHRYGRSYSGVRQHEDGERATGDVELTNNNNQRTRRQKKNLPVAVATPMQKHYESGEFDQRFPEGDDGFDDESEEWAG